MPPIRLAVLALIALVPAARAEVFIQPAAWYADYAADGFKSRFGTAFSAGITLGAVARHAVSVEVARLPWELHAPRPDVGPTFNLGSFGDGRLVPVLASYRAYFGAPTARWRGYVGASAGSTKVSGRIETLLSGNSYAGEIKEWATTVAAHAGVSLTLSPRFSAELGYRYLHLDDIDYPTRAFVGTGGFAGSEGTADFGATKAHLATFGLTLKF
jgi:opacity protein-like surface antigen